MRLIDADSLIPDTEWNDYYDGYMSYSQLQIDAAPTVELERPKGEWIFRYDYDNKLHIICSKCHYEPLGLYFQKNFCPNCGAYMINLERKGNRK